MKNYKSSPLPFQGQKRRFVKKFSEILEEFPHVTTYVDLFGGSGLLSRTVKTKYPSATVIYNDYDHFVNRIDSIPNTNSILTDLRELLKDYPRKTRIDKATQKQIIQILEKAEQADTPIDWISISASILFSGKYCLSFDEIKKETFYNRVRVQDFNATGYLQGLNVVHCDYQELYNQYKDDKSVLFLVDPPYLATDISSYTNQSWKLGDYLDVLEVLKNTNYFYFTSNKSSIIELCEWFCKHNFDNPFQASQKVELSTSVNHASKYTDIMIYKKATD